VVLLSIATKLRWGAEGDISLYILYCGVYARTPLTRKSWLAVLEKEYMRRIRMTNAEVERQLATRVISVMIYRASFQVNISMPLVKI
jgi:hypothetical protein